MAEVGWKGSQALWNGGQSCCISSRPNVAVVGVLVEGVKRMTVERGRKSNQQF